MKANFEGTIYASRCQQLYPRHSSRDIVSGASLHRRNSRKQSPSTSDISGALRPPLRKDDNEIEACVAKRSAPGWGRPRMVFSNMHNVTRRTCGIVFVANCQALHPSTNVTVEVIEPPSGRILMDRATNNRMVDIARNRCVQIRVRRLRLCESLVAQAEQSDTLLRTPN